VLFCMVTIGSITYTAKKTFAILIYLA
jgi:hypothetical protein